MFLDQSEEGIIYFSLGSNVKSKLLDKKKINLIMEAFSELPYKVLWKYENDVLLNKPSNVEIRKWFPQQDLLGHPNVKLFITQAGLQSVEEAISNEIPLLALPFLGDQYRNARKIEELGIGLHLNYGKLSTKQLKDAIIEILHNPGYKQRLKALNDILQDRAMNGLEKAVWWTEYVIRHNGARFSRNKAVDVLWYQYFLLDVLGFFLLVSLTVVYAVYAVLKICVYHIRQLRVLNRKIKAT